MNERLKQVREEAKMTQEKFGASLGVKRDSYASYESGRVVPSQTFISLLCSKYNINEEWLRTGHGMKKSESKNELDILAEKLHMDEFIKHVVEIYIRLPESSKEIVWKFIRDITPPEPDEIEVPTAARNGAEPTTEKKSVKDANRVISATDKTDSID